MKHSAPELQQVEPQDRVAGQQALLMHESPEAQQAPAHVCAAEQQALSMHESPALQQTPLHSVFAQPPVVFPPDALPPLLPFRRRRSSRLLLLRYRCQSCR